MTTTTTLARAWSITRKDGFRLGFTDHDQTLAFDDLDFRPEHGLSARAFVQASGLSVDNTEAAGVLSDDAITEIDLLSGRWDSAELRMWEVDWKDVSSRRLLFLGTLGEVTRSNGAFRAELRGLTEKLAQSRGRVYHPRCSAALGDAACKMKLEGSIFEDRAIFQGTSEAGKFRLGGLPDHESGWFNGGLLRVMNGKGKGVSCMIKHDVRAETGTRLIELWSDFVLYPDPGDEISLRAGCDKSAMSCKAKFNNFLNFRGFPHLPSEDWLVAPQQTARRSDSIVPPAFSGWTSGRANE